MIHTPTGSIQFEILGFKDSNDMQFIAIAVGLKPREYETIDISKILGWR